MGSHATNEALVGKLAGSFTLVPLFNVDRALDTFTRFEIPCAAINHLAITRVLAENLGHGEYKYERIDGKKVIFLPLEGAVEANSDFTIGLLQELFRERVLSSFHVTVVSGSDIREYKRSK